MLSKGHGSVEVWSYNENDIVNYLQNEKNKGRVLVLETMYGNWETLSESWIKVFVAKEVL